MICQLWCVFALIHFALPQSHGFEYHTDLRRCVGLIPDTACFVRKSCILPGDQPDDANTLEDYSNQPLKGDTCDVIVQIKSFSENKWHVMMQVNRTENDLVLDSGIKLIHKHLQFECDRNGPSAGVYAKITTARFGGPHTFSRGMYFCSITIEGANDEIKSLFPDREYGLVKPSLSFKTTTGDQTLTYQIYGDFLWSKPRKTCPFMDVSSLASGVSNRFQLYVVDTAYPDIKCADPRHRLLIRLENEEIFLDTLQCVHPFFRFTREGSEEESEPIFGEKFEVYCVVELCTLCPDFIYKPCAGCKPPIANITGNCKFATCERDMWRLDDEVINSTVSCAQSIGVGNERNASWIRHTITDKGVQELKEIKEGSCSTKADCWKISQPKFNCTEPNCAEPILSEDYQNITCPDGFKFASSSSSSLSCGVQGYYHDPNDPSKSIKKNANIFCEPVLSVPVAKAAGLSMFSIGGIAGGVLFLSLIAAFILGRCFVIRKRRKKANTKKPATNVTMKSSEVKTGKAKNSTKSNSTKSRSKCASEVPASTDRNDKGNLISEGREMGVGSSHKSRERKGNNNFAEKIAMKRAELKLDKKEETTDLPPLVLMRADDESGKKKVDKKGEAEKKEDKKEDKKSDKQKVESEKEQPTQYSQSIAPDANIELIPEREQGTQPISEEFGPFNKANPEPVRFNHWTDETFLTDYLPYFISEYPVEKRIMCLRALTIFYHHATNCIYSGEGHGTLAQFFMLLRACHDSKLMCPATWEILYRLLRLFHFRLENPNEGFLKRSWRSIRSSTTLKKVAQRIKAIVSEIGKMFIKELGYKKKENDVDEMPAMRGLAVRMLVWAEDPECIAEMKRLGGTDLDSVESPIRMSVFSYAIKHMGKEKQLRQRLDKEVKDKPRENPKSEPEGTMRQHLLFALCTARDTTRKGQKEEYSTMNEIMDMIHEKDKEKRPIPFSPTDILFAFRGATESIDAVPTAIDAFARHCPDRLNPELIADLAFGIMGEGNTEAVQLYIPFKDDMLVLAEMMSDCCVGAKQFKDSYAPCANYCLIANHDRRQFEDAKLSVRADTLEALFKKTKCADMFHTAMDSTQYWRE